jgi:septum formation protein
MKLILASASPRRAEILSNAGIAFEPLPVNVEEAPLPGENAENMCRRLAGAKMRAAMARLDGVKEPCIVLAADTAVEISGEILGKPQSAGNARDMLRKLSGKTHRVVTAVVLVRLPDLAACVELESTNVRFTALTPDEIENYVATHEPLDKAGAYAIQGLAGRHIDRIEGCYFNVVGLPLARLWRMLKGLGWQP